MCFSELRSPVSAVFLSFMKCPSLLLLSLVLLEVLSAVHLCAPAPTCIVGCCTCGFTCLLSENVFPNLSSPVGVARATGHLTVVASSPDTSVLPVTPSGAAVLSAL